jgi:hypothetical protein
MSTLAEEWVKEGIEQGTSKGAADLALHQLDRKVGPLSTEARERILSLPSTQLQELAIALLHFDSQKYLSEWLANRP